MHMCVYLFIYSKHIYFCVAFHRIRDFVGTVPSFAFGLLCRTHIKELGAGPVKLAKAQTQTSKHLTREKEHSHVHLGSEVRLLAPTERSLK